MDLVGIAKSVTSDDVAQKNYDGQMSPDLPWDGQSDVFFNKAGISTYKWNQVYPYRLIVIDVSKNNETVTLGSTSKTSAIDYFINGDGFCITQTLENNKWEFALPVTPQQLSIQDIYAISNTPTLRGIVEEHNGIKYKNITMAGTFGILTKRNAAIDPLIAGGGKSLFGSIAGGTIEAVNQVISTASKLSNIGHHPAQIDAGQNKISSDNNREFGTGYYYAMLCGQFLEQYAIAKKDPKNSSWRLVLDIPKRSESYVVTPVSYTSSQSINKPAEYMFQMQLKAWKRIDLNGKENVKSAPNKISLNALQSLNNTIRNLRTLVAQSTNVLKAVRADFQALMNTIRQASLLVKDVAGFVQTAINLGPNIIKDCSDTIHEAGLNLSTSFQMPNGSATSNVSQVAKAATTVGLIKGLYAKNEGIAATVADQADFNKSANNPSNSTNNTNN